MKENIGTLVSVPVRELWADEAQEFTPWLAEQADLLGEALQLDLVHEQSEVPVGRYSADLLFRAGDDRPVVVENMLATTDHDHLGKLITYMAGLQAGCAVLIATEFRPEHQSALAHLNAISREEFGFFGVVLEAWRIGSSPPAPRLRVEVHPDDWARSVRASQGDAPRGALHRRFWGTFLESVRSKHPTWTRASGSKESWIRLSSSRSRTATYNAAFCQADGERRLRAEVYVDTGDRESTKMAYDCLHDRKAKIEATFIATSGSTAAGNLVWDRLDDKRASRIAVYFPSPIEITEEARWPEAQAWLLETLGKLREVFNLHISECGKAGGE